MRFYFLLIMLHSFFLTFGQIDSSIIKICVELEDQTINDKEGIEGKLYITNKSSKSLKLPKVFDLGYILIDDKGKSVPYKKDAIYEYANKIFLLKRKVKPGETITVNFTEDRLLYENDVLKGNKYRIIYFLVHNNISRQIKSNSIELKY
ncbi:MAG: hypothetical protein ACP5D9_05720 [Mariniphaga sp.]